MKRDGVKTRARERRDKVRQGHMRKSTRTRDNDEKRKRARTTRDKDR